MPLGHEVFIPNLSRADGGGGQLQMAILFRQDLFAEAIDNGVVFFENPKLFFCVEEHPLHIAQLSCIGSVMRGKIPGLKVKMD